MPSKPPPLKPGNPQTVYVKYSAPTDATIAKIETFRDTNCGYWGLVAVAPGTYCELTFLRASDQTMQCGNGDKFDFQAITFWPEDVGLEGTYAVSRTFLDGNTGGVFFNAAKLVTQHDPGLRDESHPMQFINVSNLQSDKIVFTAYNKNYSENYYRIGFELTLRDSSGGAYNDRCYTSRDPEIQLDKRTGE